jgi:hypothetical protein
MSQVQQIEIDLAYAKEQLALNKELGSLFKNRAFNNIILNGFFRDYPAELVKSLSDPVISDSPAKFAEVQRDLQGIAVLHGYFRRIKLYGDMAERAIVDNEAALEDIRINGEDLDIES